MKTSIIHWFSSISAEITVHNHHHTKKNDRFFSNRIFISGMITNFYLRRQHGSNQKRLCFASANCNFWLFYVTLKLTFLNRLRLGYSNNIVVLTTGTGITGSGRAGREQVPMLSLHETVWHCRKHPTLYRFAILAWHRAPKSYGAGLQRVKERCDTAASKLIPEQLLLALRNCSEI